ncbi:OmpA family protein [Hymenobacter glacialis]|uniref:OmpA-like domain-containing protein n=1 Tax=Hymenobacter glacialis TaxID=1908236 RepID=A0A1G1SQM5_9BACT|nr:OmpA family protein [Hymenobacter glacialis]OGX80925.1 hypothetical protein BEN48_07055 [Hymenobacter glacialis]
MKHFLHLLLVAWLLGASGAARAQNLAMSLMGRVQSDDRKPLPGAAITVIHVPSGVRHAVSCDGAGRFVVPNLMVGGPYLIRVGEGGYQPQTVENIFLKPGKTANFTVTLGKLTGKSRNNQVPETALALADDAVAGGPVLTVSSQSRSVGAGQSAVPSARTAAPAPVAEAPASAGPAASPAPAPTARYSRYPSTRRPAAKDPIVSGHFDAKSGNYYYETGTPTTLRLPSGDAIQGVGVSSTESNLYQFLSNPKVQVDTVDLTRGWYNFDRVFFNTGKATLTKESIEQLRNIATVLKAFPNTRIKLGGYTDSTGTSNVNRQLSDARARTAWATLVDMGISPNRMDARGYGPRYSIAPNTTEEGRAMNRRLSLKVLQK